MGETNGHKKDGPKKSVRWNWLCRRWCDGACDWMKISNERLVACYEERPDETPKQD